MTFCISESEYLRDPELYDVVAGPLPVCSCTTGLSTPVGSGVGVQTQVGGTTLSITFSQVTSAGETYASLVYQSGFETYVSLNSTATFSGPVTIAFRMPDEISEEEFNRLEVVRNTPESSELITSDIRTLFDDPSDVILERDYATRTVYGVSDGFSVVGVFAQAGVPSRDRAPEPNTQIDQSCDSYAAWLGLEWLLGSKCTKAGGECCRPVGSVVELCYRDPCGRKVTAEGRLRGRRGPDCQCVYELADDR